jgi:hypothetical protein
VPASRSCKNLDFVGKLIQFLRHLLSAERRIVGCGKHVERAF